MQIPGDYGILLYRVIYKRVFEKIYVGDLIWKEKTKSKNKKGISACDFGTVCDNDNVGRLRNARQFRTAYLIPVRKR